ncbi:glycosyl transferase family 2 [Aliiruegeria haliotis]|uniref:Glycosyl transferase family 2 n=1 Tax=Aliiruegeria haliotis TaxID=1280846 RepID=A0A2T0RPE1_9RHOB|nr:glycosyltransferase family 2 protein [Aliiruegeria haliotis]PRY23007.1 glycosyl transferase family 2 [Aliiruegeria haliotis]
MILPVYNVAPYVGACIESLKAQTFTDFEVIIVDDGSTDGSDAVAWSAVANDLRFRLLSRPNGGLSAARNHALPHARGTFISFVDSDDRLSPHYLATLYDALVSTGADWCACAVRFCDADGTHVDHSAIHGVPFPAAEGAGPVVYQFDDWRDVIRHFPSAWNKLYRREFIGDIRYIEGTYYEDHPFFNALATQTDRMAYVPQPLYWQTQGRPGQITRVGSTRVFEQFRILDEMKAIMEATSRPGKAEAFEQITTRLLFERSTAVGDTDLRTDLALRGQRYLAENGIAYRPEWDPFIGRAWGHMVNGHLPLSVVLPVEEVDDALAATLSCLKLQWGSDFETVLVRTRSSEASRVKLLEIAAKLPRCTVLAAGLESREGAIAHGINCARGAYVMLLNPGDVVPHYSLGNRSERVVRAGAGIGLPIAAAGLPDQHGPRNPYDPLGKLESPDERIRHLCSGEVSTEWPLADTLFQKQLFDPRALATLPALLTATRLWEAVGDSSHVIVGFDSADVSMESAAKPSVFLPQEPKPW